MPDSPSRPSGRFAIYWAEDGQYKVSVPNYGGGVVVVASEYDALCDLIAEMSDCSSTDLVAAVRRTTGSVEADWLARIIDGERSRDLLGSDHAAA